MRAPLAPWRLEYVVCRRGDTLTGLALVAARGSRVNGAFQLICAEMRPAVSRDVDSERFYQCSVAA